MFNKTRKVWKKLAVILSVSMLSLHTVSAYEDIATETVCIETIEYNETSNSIGISCRASVPYRDVTILALRGTESITWRDFGTYTLGDLKEKIVYIDQECSNEYGEYNFSFVPKPGVPGKYVTVFVGGENVGEVETASFEAKAAAPALIPQVWYEGETKLQFKLVKQDFFTPWSEYAAEAWANSIQTVLVDGTDRKAYTSYNSETGMLEISGFAMTGSSVSSIMITTIDDTYMDSNWVGTAMQVKKTPGTLTPPAAPVVAGTPAIITVSNADDTWKGALKDTVYADGGKVENITYAEPTFAIPTSIDGETLEKESTVLVKQAYYNDATATFKVVAPTKADLDAICPYIEYSTNDYETGDEAYTETNFNQLSNKDKQAMFGQAYITLPATGVNGSDLRWKINGEPYAGKIVLQRPGSDFEDTTIEVTAEAVKEGYKTAVKTWNLTVHKINSAADIAVEDMQSGDTVSMTVRMKFPDVYDGALVAALYTEDNKLAKVRTYSVAETVHIELPAEGASYMKVMWMDMDILTPYCDYVQLDI